MKLSHVVIEKIGTHKIQGNIQYIRLGMVVYIAENYRPLPTKKLFCWNKISINNKPYLMS